MAGLEHSDGKVCGRDFVSSPYLKTSNAEKNAKNLKFRRKPQGRILVEGLHRADGTHIRFKSLEKAERHIKNMGLVKE